MIVEFKVEIKKDRYSYRAKGETADSSIEIEIEPEDALAVISGASAMLQSLANNALRKYQNPPPEEE